jgi:hypothetical protein
MISKTFAAFAFVAASASILALSPLAASVLQINGKPVSSRVRVIDGESWVPVKDVAKSQGLTVTSSNGVINLVAAGGANQVGSLTGKVGDTLFDGHWKFTLSKFEQVPSYKISTRTQTDYGTYTPIANIDDNVVTPKPGYKLYVAACTVKNGMTHDAQYEWSPGDSKTAIADTSGVGHPWVVVDIASEAFVTKAMLPGSAITFNICFAVAENATPQDVVVTLLTLGEKSGTDIRFHVSGDGGQ